MGLTPELRWERARTQHLAGRGPQPRRLPSAFEAARCEQQRRPVPPSQGPEEEAAASEEEEGTAGWRRGDRSPVTPDTARVSPPAERSPVRRQPPGKRGLSLRRRCQEGRARRTEVGVCVWGPSEAAALWGPGPLPVLSRWSGSLWCRFSVSETGRPHPAQGTSSGACDTRFGWTPGKTVGVP